MLKFTMLLLDPPTCLHSNHLSLLNLPKKILTLPGMDRNATEKSVLIPVTSQLFFQSFAESLSEAIHEIFKCAPTTLWHGGGTFECVYSKAASQDQIALPLPFRSPLHTLMICERVNWILVLLFKPWGSNPHFISNYSNASVTLRAKLCKLLDYQVCNYHAYAWSGFRFRAIKETKEDHQFQKS